MVQASSLLKVNGRLEPCTTSIVTPFNGPHAIAPLDSARARCFNPAMSDVAQSYQSLILSLREIAVLGSVAAVLGWDERTQLPPKGTDHRATQAALLAGMIHERMTSPRIGQWLAELEASPLSADPESDEAVNVRETRRATIVPSSCRRRLSRN